MLVADSLSSITPTLKHDACTSQGVGSDSHGEHIMNAAWGHGKQRVVLSSRKAAGSSRKAEGQEADLAGRHFSQLVKEQLAVGAEQTPGGRLVWIIPLLCQELMTMQVRGQQHSYGLLQVSLGVPNPTPPKQVICHHMPVVCASCSKDQAETAGTNGCQRHSSCQV